MAAQAAAAKVQWAAAAAQTVVALHVVTQATRVAATRWHEVARDGVVTAMVAVAGARIVTAAEMMAAVRVVSPVRAVAEEWKAVRQR